MPSFKEGECFICLQDVESNYGTSTMRLKHYQKGCNCDGWVHEACLEDWLYLKNSCPVCRKPMSSDDPSLTFSCAICIFCTSAISSLAVWFFYCY